MIRMLNIDIASTCSNGDVLHICESSISALKWHMGDSDMEGLYVSGSRPGVRIRCWTGENPMALNLSFRDDVPAEDRDKWVHVVRDFLAPQLGSISKIDARETDAAHLMR